MIDLFSKSSLVVLESLSFTKTLYAFDFDGTLSKIVPTPSDARLTPSTAVLLAELNELVPVAILSGRGTTDLRERLGIRVRYLIGNHGLESLSVDDPALRQAAKLTAGWISELGKEKFAAGIEIEDKKYSLAIHYRRARNKKDARVQIAAAIGKLPKSFRLIPGKFVFNILPAGAPHKGAALLELAEKTGTRHVFYIGDDDTDEDVFSLPRKEGQIMSVRVGRKNSSHADYFIRRQTQINRLLKTLIAFHQSEPRKIR